MAQLLLFSALLLAGLDDSWRCAAVKPEAAEGMVDRWVWAVGEWQARRRFSS